MQISPFSSFNFETSWLKRQSYISNRNRSIDFSRFVSTANRCFERNYVEITFQKQRIREFFSANWNKIRSGGSSFGARDTGIGGDGCEEEEIEKKKGGGKGKKEPYLNVLN